MVYVISMDFVRTVYVFVKMGIMEVIALVSIVMTSDNEDLANFETRSKISRGRG